MSDIDKRFWLITKDGERLYPYKKRQRSTHRYGYALSRPGKPDRFGGGEYVDSLEEVVRRVVEQKWNVRAKSLDNKRLHGTYGLGKRSVVDYGIDKDLRSALGLIRQSNDKQNVGDDESNENNRDERNVLSIPAGASYPLIMKYRIHACPLKRGYTYKKTEYIGFRAVGGAMDRLFQIRKKYILDPLTISKNTSVDSADRDLLLKYIKERAGGLGFGRAEKYQFFMLSDWEHILNPPYTITPNPQNHRYLKWSEVAGSNEEPVGGANVPEEIGESKKYIEGAIDQIKVNRYERDPDARKACIKHHGYRCSVCEMLLKDVYGETARNFIHVHHLKPISELKESCAVDPIHDLRPVCPNCHSIIHLKNPPFSIDEMRKMVRGPHD